MAQHGAQPKYVQEQLGHSSIQVTMDIYSHLFPNGNREWVAKLDGPRPGFGTRFVPGDECRGAAES